MQSIYLFSRGNRLCTSAGEVRITIDGRYIEFFSGLMMYFVYFRFFCDIDFVVIFESNASLRKNYEIIFHVSSRNENRDEINFLTHSTLYKCRYK